jgi:AbrB family looped-hinge helix DNA binding protein
VRVTSKGQVTIPQSIREQLGIQPGADVRFEIDGDSIRITKQADSDRGRGLIERMRGRARGGMSTDEIMALTRE